MKLSHGLGLIAAGFGTAGLMFFTGATATGCGSSSNNNNSGSSSGTASGSSSGTSGDASGSGSGSSSGGSSGPDTCVPGAANCNAPPVPPTGSKTSSTKSHNYALHTLYLGDTDRMGNMSPTAWSSFGYDLDGKITTAASTDVCTLVAPAPKANQVDGDKGIDNSFGETIMGILQTVDSAASMQLNDAIQKGSFTLMTYITGFDDSAGNMTTASGLSGALLAGARYSADGGAPSWDTSTVWPVSPSPGFISGCTAYPGGCPAGTDPVKNAKITFPSAFQSKGTFVSGTPGPIPLMLSIAGHDLNLTVASAIFTFDPKAAGSVTNGTIAGVLNTADFVAGLMSVAGNFSTMLCSGASAQAIAMQIEEASDIVLDSSMTVSNKPGTMCNAISVGLGFDATEIAPPTVIAAATAPAPNPCADAGAE